MNMPALRFKEFSSCWIKKKLGEVSTYTKGFAFKSADYQENGTRIVRVSDLTGSAIKQGNQMIFIDSPQAAKYSSYKLNSGDIVITTVGSKPELLESAVGRGILITKNDEGLLNQNLLKLNYSEKMNNSFLFRQINSERYMAHIKNIQRGNANQSNITLKDLFEFDVFIAESDEQTKIADFLTAIDEKLSQLTQKCELLTQYKKGVMQQIFSQELRFKDDDGQDFPEWEDKVLADISVKKSSNIAANKIEENEGDYKIYGASGVLKKVDFFTQSLAYISIVKDGAGVGRVFLCEPKTSVLGTMDIIQPKENVDISFLNAVLEQIDFVIYVTGSTIPHIYYKDYSKEEISVPSLKEQTKIATFLTAIDDKITATQTQLQAVKQYKQGLLQQMFV